MRYIRQQIIITTVSDDAISDKNIVIDLLKQLYHSSVDIFFEYKDKQTSYTKTHDKIRIISVNDDETINIRAFHKNGSIIINKISFDDIITIKLVTSKNNIVAGSKDVSKYELLDIGENFNAKI